MRIGVVGAGRRVERFYADVLPVLAARGAFALAGLTSRTQTRAIAAAARLGVPVFPTLDELVRGGRCDALLLAVPAQARGPLAERALELDQHLFVETPAGNHPRSVRRLGTLSHARRRVVEVAEDQSASPEAQLHRAVVRAGALGSVLCVINDAQEFHYHAIARHSRLQTPSRTAWYAGRDVRLVDGARLQLREAAFECGATYVQRFVDPKTHPLRDGRGWSVVCERGLLTEQSVTWTGENGREQVAIAAEGAAPEPGPDGRVSALRVRIAGRDFTWEDPYGQREWTRQHHGLAHLLAGFARAAREGGEPEYGIARAEWDVRTWRALELAARLPFKRVPGWLAHALLELRP